MLEQYTWIFALITITFFFSAFGNGANDVANSYATSVAARSLTMMQVGFLCVATEFIGAVALGARVTSTIKNGIIDIGRFQGRPGVLMLAMGSAELGNAVWLMCASAWGLPVSTTQTIVGALVGVGIASGSAITWGWQSGSVSQIAASWGIAPLISGAIAAALFATVKYSVLERSDSFTWAMRLIPFYISFTGAILALFIVIETPTAPSLEEFGAGNAVAIVLGVFGGMLVISYGFFMPYFHRRLVKEDARIKFRHIFLGPLLYMENPPLYFPGNPDGETVLDYYRNAYEEKENSSQEDVASTGASSGVDMEKGAQLKTRAAPEKPTTTTPEQRFLKPTEKLPLYHPMRLWSYFKYGLLRGVTMEVVSHSDPRLQAMHAQAKRYDNRVEHLFTYAQVASAMLMSIAHGSNDVANAVGPWAAAYETWRQEVVATRSPTPTWMLVVAGLLLGLGFWFLGYNVVRSLGNRITQVSPARGFSMELGAAITVMLASRLGLPVSTTQCLTGAVVGVSLMNYTFKATNWRQVAYIFSGWVMTLPAAGVLAGLVMAMALNSPSF